MKRKKKLEKKYLYRRIACGFLILSICGSVLFISIGKINKRKKQDIAMVKNFYDIGLNEEEVLELYNELNIIETNFIWNDQLEEGNKPQKIVLHHSGSESASVEWIHKEHTDKGWSGIGYHYFIKKDGKIYKGREENIIGAHVKKNNENTLGICLEGDFEIEIPTVQQNDSILNLLKYLYLKYDIKELSGHRELWETLCPGENLKVTSIKKELDLLLEEYKNKEDIREK